MAAFERPPQLARDRRVRIDDGNVRPGEFRNHRPQERIVRTAEHDGVDTTARERCYVFFYQRACRVAVQRTALDLFDQSAARLHVHLDIAAEAREQAPALLTGEGTGR